MSRSVATVAVGDEVGPFARVVTREDVRAYAEIGGDRNPLHQDDAFARAAGFPGVIAHGMFTMGHLGACVATWVGDTADVLELSAQFRAPVFPGEEIVAAGRVRAIDVEGATATLELWVTLERDGTTEYPVRKGEAVVRLAR
jgi:acyl dehydratase